jgi:hypothetical protein
MMDDADVSMASVKRKALLPVHGDDGNDDDDDAQSTKRVKAGDILDLE